MKKRRKDGEEKKGNVGVEGMKEKVNIVNTRIVWKLRERSLNYMRKRKVDRRREQDTWVEGLSESICAALQEQETEAIKGNKRIHEKRKEDVR